MDATAYYALGIPLYIVLFGVECAIGRARRLPGPSFAGSVSNIGTGLGAIVVGMLVGPLLVGLYDWAHRSFALVTWSSWWVPYVAALVAGDLANYWRHRLEHRWSMLWAVHNVHHTPQELDLSVGMRHAWLSDTYAFPFYALLPLVVPTAQFFLAMVTLTLYALFTHSRVYSFPGLGILVTPRTHALHHARNPRYVDKNFSAMFVIWDHLFGTYAAEDPADPPVFGTERGTTTYDGALAQWVGLGELARRVRGVSGVAGKLRALIAPPASEPRVTACPSNTPPLSKAARVYVVVQLAVLIAFASYVYGLHAWPAVAGAGLVVLAIVGIGGVLDQRRGARGFELVRLAVFAPAAAVIVGVTW